MTLCLNKKNTIDNKHSNKGFLLEGKGKQLLAPAPHQTPQGIKVVYRVVHPVVAALVGFGP